MEEKINKIICKKCGEEIKEGAQFCGKCGKKVKKCYILIGVILVFICVVGIYIYINSRTNKGT